MSAMTPWRAFARAVAEERATVSSRLYSQEPDYLPAALEVIEKPVSPTGRITAWILITGVALTIAWLVFGRVDIVATARGRILPADDVKLVQAANTGLVRHIYVHDGDTVRRGQPLIDLDPTVSTADETQAGKALLAAELDVARGQAIADALAGHPVRFAPPANAPADVIATQRRLIAAQVASAQAESASLAAARRSALADATAASAQADAAARSVPVLDKELAAMHELDASGFAPGLKLMDLERERSSERGNRDAALAQRTRAISDAAKVGQQMIQSLEQARRGALADLATAQSQLMLRREELVKARERSRMQRLVAPTDGTIQQLAVHTLGGVVEPARALMVVVPNDRLLVEAHVLNRDVGFVRPGQTAEIKFDAFPFTRYGTVKGRITSVSRDAVQDKTGSYYIARIALARSSIMADGGTSPLSSGMSASADIRIGSRRLISYLVSPLDAGISEAGHEH